MYDIIIIGAGPAGTAAGIYAARQGLNFLIITKDIGGQIGKKAVDIENYPGFNKISGSDLVKIFEEQLKKNQVKIILGEVLKISAKGQPASGGENPKIFEISTATGKKFEALSVIIATGADPRMLEVPGEKEFIGKGVSYCALCDGPIFKNKTVAVIGGGNSGFETALFLSNYIKKIYILEAGPEIKADKENQDLILKTGKVEIIKNAKVLKISAKGQPASGGEGPKLVGSLTYLDTKSNKENILETDGIFVEVGYSPATAFAKSLVDFSDRDEIMVQPETFQTKTTGLFAVGDCNMGKYKQIVTAAGEGAKASLAVYEYLKRNSNGKN
ncbi:MAG: FAD-dependent oxidoreductase [Patescibacteria group bacterium]